MLDSSQRIRRWGIGAACLAWACSPGPTAGIQALPDRAAAGSMAPNLASDGRGSVIMSWLEPDEDGTRLRHATLAGRAWGKPATVARGSDWFVNWADFPSVTALDGETWAAHWLVKSADTSYAYDIALAISADAGRTWSKTYSPHTDGTPTEHGFASVFPAPRGVGIAWLDGRKMVNAFDANNVAASGMTLRTAVLTRAGALHDEALIDDLVCDCCQTDVAQSDTGPLVVYRNRTVTETRDVYVARQREGRWLPGVPVGNDAWQIAGCPVNGPAIAVREKRVAVAWFTAAGDVPRLRIAFSDDDGESFDVLPDVDRGDTLGRVDLLALDDGNVVLSSLSDRGDGEAAVLLRRVSPDGAEPPVVIATTSAGRLSGFPRMARRDPHIVVAWTDVEDGATRVRSAIVDWAAL